ncbi:MAG: RNA-guided endonuclease InsQ/TnpB family protein [Caldilineaceae bacterium]
MKAFKTELDPNNVQETMLRQHCGAGRWAYNWGLERIKQAIDAGTKWPTAIDLHRELNAIKGTDALPWAYEVSKCAFQESLRNLETAVKNWRCSQKGERKGAKVSFPKLKTRKKGLGSCRFTGAIKVFDGQVQLPRIGLIRLKEHGYIPTGRYAQATITERAGHWFVSVTAEFDPEPIELTGQVIGIDVGIKTLATCSDGDTYENPKALNAKTKQLRRWQRRLSRREKGGKNRAKARVKVARLHKRIADIRQDAHNKAARAIVNKRPEIIVIEDLNVKGMFKNRKLARALSDAAFGNFGRVLGYMAADAGIEVRKAGRFFASSKTCACCGWKKEDLTLSDRTFICGDCGHTMDRDLNAAINLKNTVSSTGIYAYGDRVSPGLAQAVIGEVGILSQMSIRGAFV